MKQKIWEIAPGDFTSSASKLAPSKLLQCSLTTAPRQYFGNLHKRM